MTSVSSTGVPLLEQALLRCQACLPADDRVLGLCVFGSVAAGRADAHSDIDLGLLVGQEQLDSLLAAPDLIARVAPVIAWAASRAGDNCLFAIHEFECGFVKIDYNFFTSDDVPSWLSGEAEILYDRSGALTTLKAIRHVRQEPRGFPCEYFWIGIWNATRMLRRGELLEACDILNHLRDPLMMDLLSRAFQLPFQNYRRVEERYPPNVVQWLRRTFARPEPEELLSALAEMAALYRYLMSRTCPGGGPASQPDERLLVDAQVPPLREMPGVASPIRVTTPREAGHVE